MVTSQHQMNHLADILGCDSVVDVVCTPVHSTVLPTSVAKPVTAYEPELVRNTRSRLLNLYAKKCLEGLPYFGVQSVLLIQ